MRDDILKPSGVPRVEPHPPIKSQPRPTYFSELFSSAAKAAEAHERRQQVDNVMSIRSIPEIVQVSDYTTGGQYQRQISIKNFSRKIRRVRIEPPKTKYFNLCKSVRTDEISIAPGMQYVFYIEFNAPTQVSLNKSNRGVVSASVSGLLEIGHSLLNIHQQQILAANTYLPDLEDCVGVLMEDGSIFEIPVTATPVKPSLAIPSHVDFGTLFTSKFNQGDFDMELLDDEEWDIKSSSVDSSSIHESVIVKHVKIRNDGTKRAKFDAIYDKSLPIRISPSSVILDPAGTIFNGVETDSCDLKIAIKPIKAGKFKYDVHFDVNGGKSNEKAVAAIEASIINDAGRRRGTKLMNNGGGLLLPTSSQFKMSLVGNVLDHKIRIRDAKNSKDIDPQNLFFGSIYFGEMSLMTVRLHNRAPKPINWVISHAGQSRPYVPGQSKDLDTTDALMKAAVSVFPSEGTLPPDETSIVTFKFAPTIHAQSKGFKVSSHPPEISNYKVPMQLNLLAANGQAVYGEEPIDFTLTGETCPLIVSVSKNEITFPSTTLGKSSEKTLELKNGSDRLGLQFDFKKIANIVITPMHGRLAPFQMATIKVVYHPNQIGPLKSSLECKISSLASKECLPEEIINLREREGFSIDSASAKIMHIDLLGECSIDVNTRVTTHGVLVKPSGKQWSSSNASGRKASSRKSFENSKSLTLFLGSTPMSDSDKQVNPEWEAKSDNRDRFINYIRTSHADKVSQERIKKFGKDGVEIDYSKVSLVMRGYERKGGVSFCANIYLFRSKQHKHYHLVDSHNGLPEPNVEDNNATDKAARDLIVHPHKFGDAIVESHRPVRDDRKLKDLIEKLFEPVVHKAKASVFSTSFGAAITTGHGEGGAATAGERVNATTTTTTGGTGSTTNGMSPLSLSSPSATPDSPLTGTDLANFFASKSSIDVGTVTTHSVTRVPVNFLNATPSRHPIHISFLTHKKSGQSVHVSPKSIIVPAMSLVGVEVQIQSHQAGPLSQDITYLLNGRYKYQIHVTANVAPIHLNLDKQGVNIQLNYQLESAEEKIMPKSLAELIRPDTADSQQEHSGGFIKPKSSITLRNEGNYPASFIWSLDGEKPDTAEMSVDEAAATSNGAVVRRISTIAATSGLKSSVKKYVTEIGQDGLIEVVPKQGRILPNSELKVNFYFTPGVKPTHEESMSLHIIDNFDSNSSSIIETINVNCKAEIPGAYCSLLTSVKHGYLDMGRIQMGYANPFISSGWIDISGSSTSVPADVFSFKRMTSGGGATHLTTALWNYNVFSSSAFSHKDPIGTTKSQQQGLKVIKVKNGSQNACYFTAKTVAENSELQLSTENGFIAGNGGILDLVGKGNISQYGEIVHLTSFLSYTSFMHPYKAWASGRCSLDQYCRSWKVFKNTDSLRRSSSRRVVC